MKKPTDLQRLMNQVHYAQVDSNTVTLEQQEAMGLRRGTQGRVVMAHSEQMPSVQHPSALERLDGWLTTAGRTPNRGAQSHDTAITQAQGWILTATPFVTTTAVITTALLFLFWLVNGSGGVEDYAAAWLLLFGLGSLVALAYAHRTHMQHSPAGVELADIARQREDSANKTEVALRAIDAHHDVINKQLDHGRERWLLERGYVGTDKQLTGGE